MANLDQSLKLTEIKGVTVSPLPDYFKKSDIFAEIREEIFGLK